MSCAPDDAPILVTAAGGTVGSALVAELRASGHRVRGAFRSQAAAEIAAAAGIDTVMVNLDDPATLPAAVEGVAAVFLIAPTGPRQPDQELSLIAASRAAGVRRVVKLSVWRADELLTPIARLHRPGEEALEASDLSWTLLRPNFYMQNFLRQMATRIKNDGVITQPESRAPTSFIDARDIASVAAQVLTSDRHTGRTYSLTGPQAMTYEAVAATFSRVLAKPVRFVRLSDDQAKADMIARGLPESYADTLVAVNQAYRDGGADTVTSAVRALTGREPNSLEQFVRDHRASFT